MRSDIVADLESKYVGHWESFRASYKGSETMLAHTIDSYRVACIERYTQHYFDLCTKNGWSVPEAELIELWDRPSWETLIAFVKPILVYKQQQR